MDKLRLDMYKMVELAKTRVKSHPAQQPIWYKMPKHPDHPDPGV